MVHTCSHLVGAALGIKEEGDDLGVGGVGSTQSVEGGEARHSLRGEGKGNQREGEGVDTFS